MNVTIWFYELSAFIGMIERGEVSHGVNSHENSLAVMEVMDRARKQKRHRLPGGSLVFTTFKGGAVGQKPHCAAF